MTYELVINSHGDTICWDTLRAVAKLCEIIKFHYRLLHFYLMFLKLKAKDNPMFREWHGHPTEKLLEDKIGQVKVHQ